MHRASATRGAVVVREMMDGHRPAVWISDRYTAQQGHAAEHQTCLAHLARDVAYVVEVSDDLVPWRLQLWLQTVFALAERVTDFAASTLGAKRRSLDRQLGAIRATPSRCDLTRALQAKISRARDQLLVFLAYPGQPAGLAPLTPKQAVQEGLGRDGDTRGAKNGRMRCLACRSIVDRAPGSIRARLTTSRSPTRNPSDQSLALQL